MDIEEVSEDVKREAGKYASRKVSISKHPNTWNLVYNAFKDGAAYKTPIEINNNGKHSSTKD